MTGYSQSAVDVVTYANAFNPRLKRTGGERLYDGYLLMGRSASATPLDSGTDVLPKLEFRPVGKSTSPTIDVESQSDVSGFTTPQYTNPGSATERRPDRDAPADRYRLYEVPGSRTRRGSRRATIREPRSRCATSSAPRWRICTRGRKAAPVHRADRIETTTIDTVATFAVDDDGNALGGVRSPYLDEALARYEGSDTPGPLCGLAGVETPLDPATLAARYASVDDYMSQFTAGLDDAIREGVLLRVDRAAIIAETRIKADQALAGT